MHKELRYVNCIYVSIIAFLCHIYNNYWFLFGTLIMQLIFYFNHIDNLINDIEYLCRWNGNCYIEFYGKFIDYTKVRCNHKIKEEFYKMLLTECEYDRMAYFISKKSLNYNKYKSLLLLEKLNNSNVIELTHKNCYICINVKLPFNNKEELNYIDDYEHLFYKTFCHILYYNRDNVIEKFCKQYRLKLETQYR